MKKKAIFILVVCIIGLLIIALIPKEADEITNAVVNSNNGDVAFSYMEYSGKTNILVVALFNKDGEKLYSKTFFSGTSYASLNFHEDKLHVYIGRTKETHCYDRTGASAEVALTTEEIKSSGTFGGWKHSFGKRTYELNGYTYNYYSPTIFRDKAEVVISNETDVVIYKSPKE